MPPRRTRFSRLLLLLLFVLPALAQTLHFGAIGDSGSGDAAQLAVARQMEAFNRSHHWEFVLMLGDNVYDDGNPRFFDRKFKNPYRNLMAAGVKFHATLGNHDRISPAGRKGMAEVQDDAFGFVGRQDEYEFTAGPKVGGKTLARFICLNSSAWMEELWNYKLIEPRLIRLRNWLQISNEYQWNIVFFHNAIYSFAVTATLERLVGRHGHGSEEDLRRILEPELKGKVDVVLSGHEHFYQKIRPQNGIHYFVSGGASKIRRGVEKHNRQVEFAAEALHFMDFELSAGELKYAAISEKGAQIHSGVIQKQEARSGPTAAAQMESPLNLAPALMYDLR